MLIFQFYARKSAPPTLVPLTLDAIRQAGGRNSSVGLLNSTDRLNLPLAYLRRFARLLSGTQHAGDLLVCCLMEKWQNATMPSQGGKMLLVCLLRDMIELYNWVEQDARDALPDTITSLGRQALLLLDLFQFSEAEAAKILAVDQLALPALAALGRSEIERRPKARILIVHSEPLMAFDVEMCLSEHGHRVSEASTRKAASRLMAETVPDLVIIGSRTLDDGSSGWELADELRRCSNVGVVILTAFPERFFTGNGDEPAFVWGKPFESRQVNIVIAQALLFSMHCKILAFRGKSQNRASARR